MHIISILEIQGIKFTSRNFQLEIELKQSMVVSPDPFLDECFIKKPSLKSQIQKEIYLTKELPKDIETEKNNFLELSSNNEFITNFQKDNNLDSSASIKEMSEGIKVEEYKNDPLELMEFEISQPIDNHLDTITLKKPNQVYYKIYKAAREKAKQAKKEAMLAFLEAKNIKKTYMLDDIEDSDSGSDIEEYENYKDS